MKPEFEREKEVTEATVEFSDRARDHARVYLCYVPDDEKLARRVCNYFHSKGTPCWFPARDVSPSMPWPQCVLEAIEACSSVLVILTDNANKSGALKAEIEQGQRHGRQVLVLKATTAPVNPQLDVLLHDADWFDFEVPASRATLEAAWTELIDMETYAFLSGTFDGEAYEAPRYSALKSAKSFLVRLKARGGAIKGRLSAELSEGGRLVIGRDPTADVILNDNRASRRHAGLVVERSRSGTLELKLGDLMSTNGTWVRFPRPGDAPLSRHLTHDFIRVTDGAMVRIGNTDILVRCAPIPTTVEHTKLSAGRRGSE